MRRRTSGSAGTGGKGETRVIGVEDEVEFFETGGECFGAFRRQPNREQSAPGREPQFHGSALLGGFRQCLKRVAFDAPKQKTGADKIFSAAIPRPKDFSVWRSLSVIASGAKQS